jgi:hypothetical protein
VLATIAAELGDPNSALAKEIVSNKRSLAKLVELVDDAVCASGDPDVCQQQVKRHNDENARKRENAANFLQFVGAWGISAQEAVTGRAAGSGRQISDGERAENGVEVALSLVPLAAGARRAGSGARDVGKLRRLTIAANCIGHSFAANTAVVMSDYSFKRIDEIRVGDLVLASEPDSDSDRAIPREVTAIHVHRDSDLVDIKVSSSEGNSTIEATVGHQFWSSTVNSWVPAERLSSGEKLTSLRGETVTVRSLDHKQEERSMFDLTVAESHSYYVGTGSVAVLVHNCGSFGLKIEKQVGNLILDGDIPRNLQDVVRGKSLSDLAELKELLEISIPNRTANLRAFGELDTVAHAIHVTRVQEERQLLAAVIDALG